LAQAVIATGDNIDDYFRFDSKQPYMPEGIHMACWDAEWIFVILRKIEDFMILL
jgi:hypothetical protein